MHDCENNPFVGDRLPRGLRLSRSLYGAYLRQSLDKIEDALTARLPAVQHGADELQRHLAADDFARSEAVLATSWPDFWPVLEGSYLRQEFDFSAPEKDRSSSARHHEVNEDGDGNPVVIRGGHVLNITLPVREGPLRARSRAFAERVADTVSYRDKDDLLDVTNFLVHIAGQLGAYRDVRERLQDEVQRNSYVLLRGHVANGGRSPFSVLDRGRMFLALAGFQPTGQEGAGAIEGDLELEMAIATADLQPGPTPNVAAVSSEPFVVAGGAVRSFMAIAQRPLGELEDGTAIIAAYESRERICYLGLSTIQPTKSGLTPLYSTNIPFTEARESAEVIPPKPESTDGLGCAGCRARNGRFGGCGSGWWRWQGATVAVRACGQEETAVGRRSQACWRQAVERSARPSGVRSGAGSPAAGRGRR